MWSIKWICLVGIMAQMSSCIPTHLEKYSRRSASGPGADIEQDRTSPARASARSSAREVRQSRKSPQDVQRPPIYAVDRQTFRFHLGYEEVWNSAINVLLRNYNLTIVDRATGVITTEWDTFFLSEQVYRNRVSMRIHRVGRGTVDVIVHNNVERLQDSSSVAGGGIGSIWLPAEDVGDETNRLVQNMAIAMDQAPPLNSDGSRVARRPQRE